MEATVGTTWYNILFNKITLRSKKHVFTAIKTKFSYHIRGKWKIFSKTKKEVFVNQISTENKN